LKALLADGSLSSLGVGKGEILRRPGAIGLEI
jgi:hypothetical protein